jgi:nucleoside-diphosphate-sugar epimerase
MTVLVTGATGLLGSHLTEYDCLIPTVVHLLRADATDSEIVTQLRAKVRDHFGLEVREPATLSLARRLRDWYQDRPAGR